MGENKINKTPKDHDIHIRVTESQMEFLENVSYLNNRTKSDMIWKALEFYHNLYRYAPDVLKDMESKLEEVK